jgi:hypothetical protein
MRQRQRMRAVDELEMRSQGERSAPLCYQADYNRCHRTYVARALAVRTGVRICQLSAGALIEDRGREPAALDSLPAW